MESGRGRGRSEEEGNKGRRVHIDCVSNVVTKILNLFLSLSIPTTRYCPLLPHRKTVVVGSGYIAVELAGILNALGSDVSIVVRYNKPRSHCRSHRLDRFVMGLEKLNFELSSRVGLICNLAGRAWE